MTARRVSRAGSGETETFADAVALQFPTRPAEGAERPYFLMGDAQAPDGPVVLAE